MSDALCGPSNALQNFQKHTSVDRTLQQDRLISRQSPSQGFRSQNNNEGILDPEFAAFESNNLVGAPLPGLQHAGHFIAPAPQMPMSHPAEASNWAGDFQNLHISGQSQPMHHQSGPSAASMSVASQQAWHSEFTRQHQQHTPVHPNHVSSQRFQPPSFGPSYAMHGPSMGAFTPAQETTINQISAAEAFDESAFEAAFEQAKADMASQIDTSVTEIHASESLNDKNLTEDMTTPQPTETIRIGSDTIPQSNKEDPQAALNDADELARTAGQLLNSVSNETNQKFRESNFLALMRRIRDREVQVEGDEFRESLHPGGKYYPEGKRQEDKGNRPWRQISQDNYVHVMPNDSNPTTERLSHKTTGATMITSDTIPETPHIELAPKFGSADHDSLFASWNHGDRWA